MRLAAPLTPVAGLPAKRNARNEFPTYELNGCTQAPANRNRAVLFPAELKFLRFKN